MRSERERAQSRLAAERFRTRHPERALELARSAYYNHREERLAHLRDVYVEEREWFNSLKDAPCKDCEMSFPPCCMEFDHVRGKKKFAVCRKVGTRANRPKILEEIAKCDLVCANCHRIRTYMIGRPLKGNFKRCPKK